MKNKLTAELFLCNYLNCSRSELQANIMKKPREVIQAMEEYSELRVNEDDMKKYNRLLEKVKNYVSKQPIGWEGNRFELDNLDRARLTMTKEGAMVVSCSGTKFNLSELSMEELKNCR